MTVEKMIIGVNLGVQKVDSNAYDNLLAEEILYYLNKASREYVRRQVIYLREDLKQLSRQDFISSTKSGYNLGSLLKSHSYSNSDLEDASGYDNAKEAPLSDIEDDVFDFVYGQAKIDVDSGWKACKFISTAEIHMYSKTDYNDPVFRRYPIANVGNNLLIFHDSNVHSLNVIYAKVPDELVVESPSDGQVTTSELPVHVHDDLVNLTVTMILEDIKSVRPYEQNQNTKGE